MMYSRIVGGNYQHATDARGVPPTNFWKMDALRLNLRAFRVKLLDALLENCSMVMIVATHLHI